MVVTTDVTVPHFSLAQTEEIAQFYRENGFAVVKSVFTEEEIARAHVVSDRIKAEMESGALKSRGNSQVICDGESGQARACFWVSMLDEYLDQVRTDSRLLQILEPMIGNSIRQLTNQFHWKPPGTNISVSFHTDRVNRKPDDHFRDLANSFVQLGIAIDPMTADNGPLLIVPRSHLSTEEIREEHGNYSNGHPSRELLANRGYTDEDLVPVLLEPGDVALWHPDTIHGSDENTSDIDRCMYISGYIKASSTWRGNWAFIKGQSVPVPPIDASTPVSPNSCDENWKERFPL